MFHLLKPPVRRRRSVALALMAILLSASCDGVPGPSSVPQSHGGPVKDQPSLIDALRASGLTVWPLARIQQPVLAGRGETVQVNSETIEIYEYTDESQAKKDAANIQPNGTITGQSPAWAARPHFFQKGRIIVIYAGVDSTILSAVESAMGKPIAVGP